MAAIRIARGHTKKSKILKFNGCYHGHTDSMLIKAGSGLAGTSTSSSAGVTEQTSSETLICELGDIKLVEEIFNKNKNEIAAVFIEPLPANNGLLVQTHEYLKQLRELCNKHNTLLVFDEVISGFRVGFGGMAEKLSIEPDIVTYGKIIGGGFPVGSVAGKSEIMDALAPIGEVYQAGTLSANPVAMVAGLANLEQLTPDFYKKLETQSENIYKVFTQWFAKSEFSDYSLKCYSSLFWPIPTTNNILNPHEVPKNINERFYKLFETLLNKGIYLSPNAFEVGFVSIAHDQKIAQELEERLWS